ncbi:MAG: C39 family peptidase [Spirochaetes bacterium]|nr:C39 family peptidase [Spirochaetota bacterium]
MSGENYPVPVESSLPVDILPQPNETTCGPTCLHALYRFYGETLDIARVVREVRQLEGGGTFAVMLANHALRRGYDAMLYSFNLKVFDPSWFDLDTSFLATKLAQRLPILNGNRTRIVTEAFIEYFQLGGRIRFTDLSAAIIRKYINRGIPMITGLSSTWLYRSMREYGAQCTSDDMQGEPGGHFVVLSGYDRDLARVRIADPYLANPLSFTQTYMVEMERLLTSILLGIVTHDADLLILTPREKSSRPPSA